MLPTPRLVIAARILTGLSQADLATAAGIGIATLSRYERGESNPRTDKLNAILGALREHGIQFVEETDAVAEGILRLKRPHRDHG
jgi:transcriptional regulator with XRE-family HTH domain